MKCNCMSLPCDKCHNIWNEPRMTVPYNQFLNKTKKSKYYESIKNINTSNVQKERCLIYLTQAFRLLVLTPRFKVRPKVYV